MSRRSCENGPVLPDRLSKRFTCTFLLLCCCVHGTALAQVEIPFGVELTGDNAVPPNAYGLGSCGRLWLRGTNLYYRVATGGRGGRPVELRGPAAAGTNGPLLYVLVPCSGGGPARNLCDAAAGIPLGPLGPGEDPPPPVCVAEGMISLQPEHIPELLGGLWFASQLVRAGPQHRPPLPDEVEIRGQIFLLDSDVDGVPDYLDHCPNTVSDSIVNRDGCSIDQLCPCEAPWKNHGEFVNCMKDVLRQFINDTLISFEASRLLFQWATESDCGKRNDPKR